MIRTALLALLALALSPLAFAQAPKTVAGDWITLGDVTPVTGEAAGMLIGPAPPQGQTLALDPAFLISLASKSGVILAIPLDQPVYVVRGGGNANSARQANSARVGNPAPQIAGASTTVQVLVLVRDVAKGEIISDGDLDWIDARAPRSGAANADFAVGKEMKRALRAGQPLLQSDLKAPAVIRKGEQVKIVYATSGVRLSVDGVAQADAARGETLRILNTYSKRTIEAVAESAGEARILSSR